MLMKCVLFIEFLMPSLLQKSVYKLKNMISKTILTMLRTAYQN